MLKNIPSAINPELLKILDEMGHGDEIVVADANFPAETYGRRVIRSDGIGGEEMVSAIAALIPLDGQQKSNCYFMATDGGEPRPPVWNGYLAALAERGEHALPAELERGAFYERAGKAFAVVQTGERALYANIILRKGTL